jgi:hypothetical protein
MKKHLNKVRNMAGVKVGQGSAGRVKNIYRERNPKPDSFKDVYLACREFLTKCGETTYSFGG